MDLEFCVGACSEGRDWLVITIQVAGVLATTGLLFAAVNAGRSVGRQLALTQDELGLTRDQLAVMQQARADAVTPILSVDQGSVDASGTLRFRVANVGTGPAVDVNLNAWVLPRNAPPSAAPASESVFKEHPKSGWGISHFIGSLPDLGAGAGGFQVTPKQNAALESGWQGAHGYYVILDWSYKDILGHSHPPEGVLRVVGLP